MKRDNIIALTLSLFVIVAVFAMVSNRSKDKQPDPAQVDAKEYTKRRDSMMVVQAKQDSADAVINRKIAAQLKTKFLINKDEFKGVSFLQHKHWGKNWPDETTIYCYLNSEGSIFLVSNFYSEDWIFHSSISVLINGQKLESDVVPTYSSDNITKNYGGSVWENVTYTGDAAQKIIEFIASNTDKPVKVRLNGRQYYHDIVLSNADKNAFKDVWEYSKVMRY